MAFDMSALLPPGKVAVLLSEMQRNQIGDMTEAPLALIARELGIVAAAVPLVNAARERGAPVIHCLANTAPGRFGANTNARLFNQKKMAKIVHDVAGDMPIPELYEVGDILSPRDHGLNPMADGQLEKRLRNAGITTVVVAGISVNIAILNLAMDAVNAGYQVIVAGDAISGYPRDYVAPVIQNSLSMIATVASAAAIVAAWSKG